MVHRARTARFCRLFPSLLVAMVCSSTVSVLGQAPGPPSPVFPTRIALPAADGEQQISERLGKLENQFGALSQRYNLLWHENQELKQQLQASLVDVNSRVPSDNGGRTQGSGRLGWSPTSPRAMFSSQPYRRPSGLPGQSAPSLGGGSKASGGGDPTTIGRAQEVGNRNLGKVGTNPYYDFSNGGFHVATQDEEFSFAISGMTQLDAMVYRRPTGLDTSSGFYNPRSRIYFHGNVTKPITWEFSFQNFYDTVALLDAYVNFDYDPRFQVRIGRYKTPFGYEFYRVHIWDLLAPERSLWANNFESNRRFGLMAWGVLLDQRVEYAVGSFDTQRNSLRAFNGLQDFEAFLNFKPFYPAPEGFLLRNLQFGGSVDVGNENQGPVPAVLRADQSPGGAAVDSASASNAASLPFLAFNSGVLEKGNRALWEAHFAHYLGGLSFLSALEGGHESYSNGAATPVHVPVNGWFVQTGYIVTGETIRDRTLLQPLRPFDLRRGRFGPGAWEPTARYSQLDLGSQVFTAGLADPRLWTNHAKMVDVGANWYLNQFVKVYFDWEHVMFGTPVIATSGRFTKHSDLFWTRVQLYF